LDALLLGCGVFAKYCRCILQHDALDLGVLGHAQIGATAFAKTIPGVCGLGADLL